VTVQGGQGLMSGRRKSSYPYADPFSPEERAGIVDAIAIGIRRLRAAGKIGATSSETDITQELIDELNSMLDEEPPIVAEFSSGNLETVIRGNELCSYNKAKIEKRPDMVIRPSGHQPTGVHRAYSGLFVECKVVDAGHTMDDYCGRGLRRFLEGEYAWAMPFGMMLGYARSNYQLPGQLQTHLQKYPRYDLIGTIAVDPAGKPNVHVTVHTRGWKHVSGDDPGDLCIEHLWCTI